MEVGAVKQAFNNEVILLKKKLNQAKVQVIHKLTRKAKTLTEKKAPEHLKEKLKRKAESAVNEVLIIKKIKARDIAKFIITHTGQVNEYLNRPKVDNDKACARLVLHKAMQDKYKFIRNKFGNIPIKDLFMSRQERLKLKKEAREQQKNKKKKNKESKTTSAAGDWDVEEMKMINDDGDSDEDIDNDKEIGSDVDIGSGKEIGSDEEVVSDDEIGGVNEISADESKESGDENLPNYSDDNDTDQDGPEDDHNVSDTKFDSEENESDELSNDEQGHEDSDDNRSEDNRVSKVVKLKPANKVKPAQKPKLVKSNIDETKIDFDALIKNRPPKVKENNTHKKVKENKNKNLKEKLQSRKFGKDTNEDHMERKKIVDPFFKTATGENYLTLAEPRERDEVKEVHKQGNRQARRAALFGRKYKPKNNFTDNFNSNKFDERDNIRFGRRNDDRLTNGDFNRNSKFNNKNSQFGDRNDQSHNDRNDRNSKFNDRNDRFNSQNVNNNRNEINKEEKLHPSWEAKRKMKAMPLLPAQGKKIVFE